MGPVKRLAFGLIGAGALIGLKFYSKADTYDQMKASLERSCAADDACVAAVHEHFDVCFDQNYDMGSRTRAAAIKPESFLSCFNDRSGVEHFSLGNAPEETTTTAAH